MLAPAEYRSRELKWTELPELSFRSRWKVTNDRVVIRLGAAIRLVAGLACLWESSRFVLEMNRRSSGFVHRLN
jgi:hypothetical protein